MCQDVIISQLTGPDLLKHMGAHILHDARMKDADQPCGLCLSQGGSCIIRFTKGSNPQVDIKNSTCPNIFQIRLKSAAKFSQSSPCTNVPLQCPLCPPDSLERIWKYNLHAHLSSHKDTNPEFHKELYDLAENELTLMKAVFLTKPRKSKNKSHAPTKLTLSDVHSTRNIMRYILSFTHSLLTLMLIYFCV